MEFEKSSKQMCQCGFENGNCVYAISAIHGDLELVNKSEKKYRNQFETLRQTIFDIGNPFLVSLICESLDALSQSIIDVTDPKKLIAHFEDPRLPSDLKTMLMQFARMICENCIDELFRLDQRLNEVKEEIADLGIQLASRNQALLKFYESWEDFKLLFSFPSFMALKDIEFKKLKELIDQRNAETLRNYVISLSKLKKLDLDKIEQLLKQSGYKYDLDTLLIEIIDNKPPKSDSIVNY
jgi:hypothetical protein